MICFSETRTGPRILEVAATRDDHVFRGTSDLSCRGGPETRAQNGQQLGPLDDHTFQLKALT